jgi:hypothetical protein
MIQRGTNPVGFARNSHALQRLASAHRIEHFKPELQVNEAVNAPVSESSRCVRTTPERAHRKRRDLHGPRDRRA